MDGTSDMSIGFCGEKEDIDSPLCTPSSIAYSKCGDLKDTTNSGKLEFESLPARVDDGTVSGREEEVVECQDHFSPYHCSGASEASQNLDDSFSENVPSLKCL